MPILCKVNRGDFIESMHVAFVVVVDSKGNIIYSNGDAHYLTLSLIHISEPTRPY